MGIPAEVNPKYLPKQNVGSRQNEPPNAPKKSPPNKKPPPKKSPKQNQRPKKPQKKASKPPAKRNQSKKNSLVLSQIARNSSISRFHEAKKKASPVQNNP